MSTDAETTKDLTAELNDLAEALLAKKDVARAAGALFVKAVGGSDAAGRFAGNAIGDWIEQHPEALLETAAAVRQDARNREALQRLAERVQPLFAEALHAGVGQMTDGPLLAQAEPLLRRALAASEAAAGPDHPSVALCLNNLALVLKATRRLDEAAALMQRALAIDELHGGPEHPNVVRDLNHLGQVLKAGGRLAEAETLFRRAIAAAEAGYGATHPSVAANLKALASVLRARQQLGQIEPLLRRALAIDEAAYGPAHPRVARDLNNLAQFLGATKRAREAKPLLQRAHSILVQSCGAAHPWTKSAARGLLRLSR